MNDYALQANEILTGDGGRLSPGHVIVRGSTIADVASGAYRGDLPCTDLGDAQLTPGLIDLMLLGGFGKSVSRDNPMEIAREYLKLGVTAFQFCIGTLDWDGMAKVAANAKLARAAADDPNYADAARVMGVYLEGPFQHPDFTGASLKEHALAPTPENCQRIIKLFGDTLTAINISPGVEGAAAAVRFFVDAGVQVAMAHSNASADDVLACIDAGATHLGHAFDNNSGRIGDSGVQQPTLEHVALTDERIRFIHLIADGTHVDPILIDMMIRCRGLGSLVVITDGNQRLGSEDGEFIWDDGRTMSKSKGVCRTAEGWLAGSATPLPDMYRNLLMFTQADGADAIQTVTWNPARGAGMDDRLGLLRPGYEADLVAWDPKTMTVKHVWRAGKPVDVISSFAEVEYVGAAGA